MTADCRTLRITRLSRRHPALARPYSRLMTRTSLMVGSDCSWGLLPALSAMFNVSPLELEDPNAVALEAPEAVR